jgi:hypothetical protein
MAQDEEKTPSAGGNSTCLLLADYRPGFTLWKRRLADVDVLVTQLEGGGLLSEDITEGLALLEDAILKSDAYITLYDLTNANFEAASLLPHAFSVIDFASKMRMQSEAKQKCMISICEDERARNWIRWILDLVPFDVNFHIFKDAQQAWETVASHCQGGGKTSYDAFGEDAQTPSSIAGLSMESLLR